jgi:hypothetical protein
LLASCAHTTYSEYSQPVLSVLTGYSECSHGVPPLGCLLHVHTRRTLSTHSRYSEYSSGTLSAHTGCSHWLACFMCTHGGEGAREGVRVRITVFKRCLRRRARVHDGSAALRSELRVRRRQLRVLRHELRIPRRQCADRSGVPAPVYHDWCCGAWNVARHVARRVVSALFARHAARVAWL